jgi:hypothetical protein
VLKLDLNEIYERCAVLFLSNTEVWTFSHSLFLCRCWHWLKLETLTK